MKLGSLLPTIAATVYKLKNIKSKGLVNCTALVNALLNGIEKRFGPLLNDEQCLLAAAFHPMFRLIGLETYDSSRVDAVKKVMEKKVEDAIRQEAAENSKDRDSLSGGGSNASNNEDDEEEDFFNSATQSIEKPKSSNSLKSKAQSLVKMWLDMKSKDLFNDAAFLGEQIFINLFIKYNTAVPSSAARCLATAVSGWLSLTTGLAMGFSATLLPVLQKDKSFPFDETLVSWIASITPLSMVIGCLCAGPLIDGLGRKASHISLAILSLLSWFILGFATNNTLLLIGRFISGLSIGANRPVSLVYLGEITEPKYRSLLLLFPSVFLSLSIIVSHLMGGYIYWRTCCFIYAATNFVAFLLLLFLKESPIWLISRGKIAEGKQSFIWLRGNGIEAEKELNLILQRQEEKVDNYYCKDIFNLVFMKALVTNLFLAVAAQFCGVNLFVFYAIEISRSTFQGDIDPFILMIVLDVVRSSSVFVNLGCNRYISSRKTAFLIINGICCFILLGIFIYMLNIFRSVWLSIILAVLYIASGGSIVTLAWSFIPELFSSTLRGLGTGIASSMSYFLLFIIVKIYPGFTAMFGQEAMYISFAVIIILNSVILHFLLPETNGRSLQELEDSYNKSRINISSSL